MSYKYLIFLSIYSGGQASLEANTYQDVNISVPAEKVCAFTCLTSGHLVIAGRGVKELYIVPQIRDGANTSDQQQANLKGTNHVLPRSPLSIVVIGRKCALNYQESDRNEPKEFLAISFYDHSIGLFSISFGRKSAHLKQCAFISTAAGESGLDPANSGPLPLPLMWDQMSSRLFYLNNRPNDANETHNKGLLKRLSSKDKGAGVGANWITLEMLAINYNKDSYEFEQLGTVRKFDNLTEPISVASLSVLGGINDASTLLFFENNNNMLHQYSIRSK